MFARNATQLARRTCAARTHLQVRSYAQSLRDRQLAHRKKLHEQRQREQEQAEQELAQQPAPATDIPEQRFELTKFNTRAINADSIGIPPLDVVHSGETRDFKWSIQGHENQIVEIDIQPGSSVVAETGAMLEMTDGIDMDTKARGGMLQSFKRVFTGQGLFLTEFINNKRSGYGRTVFSSPYPSKILALDLQALGGALICQKNAFLVGSKGVEIEIAFTKNFTSGFFGGEGFILQQLHGDGMAFVHAGGAVIKRVLAPGEVIKVSTGSLVAFQPSVEYDVQMIRGVKNALFGGEGIFLATLKGPGLVILQSLPFDRLVGAIASRVSPSGSSGSNLGLPIPFLGGASSQNGQLEQRRDAPNAVGPASGSGFGSGLGSAVAGGAAAGLAAGAIGHMLHGGGGHNNTPDSSSSSPSSSSPPPPSDPYGDQQQGGYGDDGQSEFAEEDGWGDDGGGDDFGGDE